ncbi:uncharacterized membrane protein (UPF0127 family) [Variovorax boronicumulans]|uniref:DUF192 domain-containing protein n=1 Tax=Variovorax boronicumulans TaxID=436515 RepID=UPI002781CD4F|nr:DUF192 domain-containing protein [Variovorax boronicumulans]MDP9994161.1 uncharacterized membrane protein (UPF0127 family) [Variovorax boronicumulans]MDQ0001748.1 uncharacterized membrane protein (UPF0127 family) [Variovorax boronicumulans]
MRIVSLRSPQAQPFGPVRVAERGWDRTRGLLGRPRLAASEGLLIMRCSSVHTVGMRYPIDVVFLDRHGGIARVVESLRPMRVAMCLRATHVLELAAGQARRLALRPGSKLSGW